jgi:serine/threonine-protein kinase
MNFTGWNAVDIARLGPVGVAVVVLLGIVLILFLIVLLHHALTDSERRKNRERFESASITLAPLLVAASPKLKDAVDLARRSDGDRAVALVLRRARHDLDSPVAASIVAILDQMGEIDTLVKEANSRRDWKRTLAVRGLGECGGLKALRVLITAADDPSSEVRRAAREGLLADGTPKAIHVAIRSFIRDLPRRAGWRRSFYARLAVSAADELTELIRSGELNGVEEKLAIEALGDAGRPAALKLALERVGSEDAESRGTAMRVIGKVGSEREIPLLLEGMKDPEWFVRAAAARAIEWLLALKQVRETSAVHKTAAEHLGGRLGDASWWVRANAARALSRIGQPGVNILLHYVESTDRYARDAAIAAISMAHLPEETRISIRKKIDSMIQPVAIAAPHAQTAAQASLPGGIAS